MKCVSNVRLAVLAIFIAGSPVAAAAATLEAFAGITVTFETEDSSNPVSTYTRQTILNANDTDGDGVNDGGATQLASSLTNAPVFTTSNQVNATSTAVVEGEATFKVDLVQRFTVDRSLADDRAVTISLAPLDGLGGLFMQAFGQSGALSDLGSAFAAVTLERNDFEGTLFFESVFRNLFNVAAGDFVNDQKGLTPVFLPQIIPKREDGGPSVTFTLTMRVETFALAQPEPPVNGVIPVPMAAPLLASGLGMLYLLRRRSRG